MLKQKSHLIDGKRAERVGFFDGFLNIVEADGRQLIANKYEHIPYGEQSLGVVRYYQAKVSGEQVDIVVAVPAGMNISQSDIIELFSFHNAYRAEFYQISLIQKKDTQPESIFLTLKGKGVGYADKRENQ